MSDAVLIVGYGRFGQALATLLTEAGVEVRAIDPVAAVPDHLRPHGHDPVETARFVFLCVPVWAFDDALASLRPSLGPNHVVVDVSSVRHGPERSMRSLLGSAVPWVGTHPLFGPSSVSVGERPLRVVVAENELHTSAVDEVVALYERIGCTIRRESADAHDERMAYTHALAFFIAKALMDVGAPIESEFVPPSFRSMARTVDSVRSDAAHLFLSIQKLNPHAGRAREDLLSRLEDLNRELGKVEPEEVDVAAVGELFAIPGLGEAAPELRETRDLIDDLDRELVRLIARRAQLARRAGRIKREHGSGVRDVRREIELLKHRREWARDEDLDAEAVSRVFEAVIALARGAQEAGGD